MNNNWDDKNPQQAGSESTGENAQHMRWRHIPSEDPTQSKPKTRTNPASSTGDHTKGRSITARARSRFPSRISRRKQLEENLEKPQNEARTPAPIQTAGQKDAPVKNASIPPDAPQQTSSVSYSPVEQTSSESDFSTESDTPLAAQIFAAATSSVPREAEITPPEVPAEPTELTRMESLNPAADSRHWDNLIVDSYEFDDDEVEEPTTEMRPGEAEHTPWQPVPGMLGKDSQNNEMSQSDEAPTVVGSLNTTPTDNSVGTTEMAPNKKTKLPKAKLKTKRPRWQRALIWFLWISLIGIILCTIFFIISFFLIKIPPVDEAVRIQRTSVTYADGKTEIGSLSEVDRTIIDPKTLPDYVGKAVVASEDRTFYENSGVDLKGIVRAAWNNIQGKPRQGASTLTQQYVENYYKGSTKGYIGKYREAILALKINQSQSKEEILGNYLNTIYFGRRAYGIEAAAQAYFGKPAKELTLSESALIAGIIPAPSAWDPSKRPEKAKQRWQRVIKLMKEDGFITAAQANEAKFPEKFHSSKRAKRAGNSGYILDQVTDELKAKAGMKDFDLSASGYKIVTTLDPEKMKLMEETVKGMPKGSPNLRAGMISVDNKTGGIIAEYAGPDYNKSQRNYVTEDVLQAGSTFKPFALLAALDTGEYSIYSRFSGASPMTFDIDGKPYTARNYGNVSYGVVDLRRATAQSINTAYLKLNEKLGPEKTKEMAIKLGIPKTTLGLGNELSNTLGSASPHLIDLAQAYSTVANYGNKIPVHIVSKVLSPEGEIVYSAPTAGKQVVDPETAKKAIPALRAVLQRGGSGVSARINGYDIIGKTGTSSDSRSALFVGAIPQWTTIVGLYQSGPNGESETISPIGGVKSVTGSTIPALVWHRYMDKALDGVEVERFEKAARQEIEYASSPEVSHKKQRTVEKGQPEEGEQNQNGESGDSQDPGEQNSDSDD